MPPEPLAGHLVLYMHEGLSFLRGNPLLLILITPVANVGMSIALCVPRCSAPRGRTPPEAPRVVQRF